MNDYIIEQIDSIMQKVSLVRCQGMNIGIKDEVNFDLDNLRDWIIGSEESK